MPTSPRLPWPIVAVSTALALAAAVGTYVLLADDDGDDPPAAGFELTPEGELSDLDEATFTTFEGEEVPLASLRGTPAVVNFFASTCIPCITEMPAFEEVFQELGDEVAFLGLAAAGDRTDDALALVERTGVTYPTAQDEDGSVMRAVEGTVLPTTVLLDADGVIVSTHTGALEADELRALLADELGIAS